MRSFLPEPADDEAELLAGVHHRRVIFGHTHLPFRRVSDVEGIELPCPDQDGDRRSWFVYVVKLPAEVERDAAIEALRARGCHWPAILMTGHERAEIEREALIAGLHAVLEKPFDTARLAAELEAIVPLVPGARGGGGRLLDVLRSGPGR